MILSQSEASQEPKASEEVVYMAFRSLKFPKSLKFLIRF
ncbi:hypothetical protein COLO4_16944 [Corchorus olitorius]|uniref:Uncharacterized protein n=1 Tax=Corchorus olitorius TaxID=93759 RepID=A0A1R3JEW9_9ROSI|nr:hypothetical protein COLO4_16944 [Corchorus olitorius]